ncbi:cupin domain-containing protein [Curtobacterium sp. APC 4022]|uniref:cupin domain-containing protein n=1 Tax=Curtobacterium sp. APC 4022 TaxID=3035201 RepID=UPI0025B4C767|nr:cupin domain-containing protein [Curtobacterium sp. APC 4022]MDN3479350.1 cupin domain-containing protein [Curtobacterium sp. APC 4022]
MTGLAPTTTLLATVDGPDGSTYEVRHAVFPPGSTTGWHRHDARQTGLVVRGELTHASPEATHAVGPGHALVEEPRIVHEGRATGTDDTELLYVAHRLPGTEIATPADPPAAVGPVRGSHVTVALGLPVFVHALRYTAMYGPKPFAEALLVYRDNGTYTILSPGEDHHGCYVSATAIDAGTPPRHVAFMSWPSADWDSNVAAHTLTFAADTGAFTQELRLPGDAVPRAQHGFAAPVEGQESIDVTAGWSALRQTHDDTFAGLAARAAASGTAR